MNWVSTLAASIKYPLWCLRSWIILHNCTESLKFSGKRSYFKFLNPSAKNGGNGCCWSSCKSVIKNGSYGLIQTSKKEGCNLFFFPLNHKKTQELAEGWKFGCYPSLPCKVSCKFRNWRGNNINKPHQTRMTSCESQIELPALEGRTWLSVAHRSLACKSWSIETHRGAQWFCKARRNFLTTVLPGLHLSTVPRLLNWFQLLALTGRL